MAHKGYTQGNTVILVKPLPVPDGTEVSVIVTRRSKKGQAEKKPVSVAEETFGLIPAEPALVQQVLDEDLYEA